MIQSELSDFLDAPAPYYCGYVGSELMNTTDLLHRISLGVYTILFFIFQKDSSFFFSFVQCIRSTKIMKKM
ncbi:hypothetical protein RhiirC2_396026 [Rhizophagus irregularis]|uniref:Uncharacterized protein n=1 Tax=Rhizophagus irregularis TaxID=588596 RepID=A0A2N1NDT8_9GLOM|nr:hypothetical protein RhiirC2_396026 [Rhizophagus irregularis]